MYLLLSFLLLLLGLGLLIFAPKLTQNPVAIICLRTAGTLLVFAGARMCWLCLSGAIQLPLSRS